VPDVQSLRRIVFVARGWYVCVLLILLWAAGPASAQQPAIGATADGVADVPPAAGVPPAPIAAVALDAWRDHLRPCDAERAWERIGWHASFADGLRAANAERKPLLLWIMNGHPLGCT
jgi:hypothetical protein